MRADVRLLRHLGNRGERIVMHRAFRRLHMTSRTLIGLFLLVPSLTAMEFYAYPGLVDFWQMSIGFWAAHMDLPVRVYRLSSDFAGVPFDRLALELPGTAITQWVWLAHATSASLAGLLTVRLPERMLPLTYMVRILCGLQFFVLLFFLFFEAAFPYSIIDHTRDIFGFRVFLLMILPSLLGLTYFIFEACRWRKLLACFTLFLYFVLSLPLLLLGHALLIAYLSPLVMPLLYLAFGPLLDTLIFVALYSWVVTWSEDGLPLRRT